MAAQHLTSCDAENGMEAVLGVEREPASGVCINGLLPRPATLKPIRVLIIADRPGWCFSRRAAALRRHAPPDMRIDIVHYGHSGLADTPYPLYDAILCLPPLKVPEIRFILSATGSKTPLISSWNSGPNRPGYDIGSLVGAADFFIVNNWQAWLHAQRTIGSSFRGCHISNGVDLNFYQPTVPIAERPNRILWMANKDKAEDPHDVKGYQLIARPLEKMFASDPHIDTDFRAVAWEDELTETELRDWYNSGSVFLVTSVTEGTPNVGLEAAACGCVVVSTRVGNMVELIRDKENGVLLERICAPLTPEFVKGIRFALEHKERLSRQMRRDITASNAGWDWQPRCAYYFEVFRRAASGALGELKPFSYLNCSPAEI